jgi:hypothetical protein
MVLRSSLSASCYGTCIKLGRAILFLIINLQANNDVENDEDLDVPSFSCMKNLSHLHTHLPAQDALYHLGPKAFTTKDFRHLSLTDDSWGHWSALTSSKKVRGVVEKLHTIRIPGGKMDKSKGDALVQRK